MVAKTSGNEKEKLKDTKYVIRNCISIKDNTMAKRKTND
jgi:hypothetical protein